MYIEYGSKAKDTNPEWKWQSFSPRLNAGRNYLMFGILCKGVRTNPTFSFEGKGLPENLGLYARVDSRLFISDSSPDEEGHCSMEEAERYSRVGHKIIEQQGKPTWVEHPDWHSHTWLTLEEFEAALNFYNENAQPKWELPEYEAILAAMKRFDEMGYDTRLIFWFDN